MKCYVIPAPKGIDSLTLAERPDPTPGAAAGAWCGSMATSLNYRDLLTIRGASTRGRRPNPT
jgi:NADPH:quinone reductase-like Zn-dependent oxidoreductase